MANDSLWGTEVGDDDPLEGVANPDWKPDSIRMKARMDRCRQCAKEREDVLRRLPPINWDRVVY